ncbi:MAG: GTP cyclohydrolase II [Chloroflexi bacterium]|nr:MAG: GTP cyclohydrolase II [Chloroflexota bacterium]MBL1193367.1 GTP cyclohydrolase II [Chloroflexota bacterium]NOH10659.1 GTP cyclohydrolase II [Chloroflexota bacterium]
MSVNLKIQQVVNARIPTPEGNFQLCLYTNSLDDKEHMALMMGDVASQEDVLVRVHSECFTGDVLGSLRCDCGEQLALARKFIADAGQGIVIYMRQEGRGIGLQDKLHAYNLQDDGLDTVEANLALGHQADARDYTIAAAILKDLGVDSIQLLTNNPAKIEEMTRLGVKVNGRVEMLSTVNPENERYLQTKVQRMNHMLDLPLERAMVVNGNNGAGD